MGLPKQKPNWFLTSLVVLVGMLVRLIILVFALIIWDFLFIFELNNMLRKTPSNQTMSRMIAINDNLGAKLLKNKD